MNDIVIYTYTYRYTHTHIHIYDIVPWICLLRVQRNLVPKVSLSQELDCIPSYSRIRGVSNPLSIRMELSNQAAAGAEGRGRLLYSRGVLGLFTV